MTNFIKNLKNTQKYWFFLAILLLFQLKRVFNIWQFEDLTSGDTSAYFMDIYDLFFKGITKPNWSPLYIGFYATIYKVVGDAFTAQIIARLVIVFSITSLVFTIIYKFFNSLNIALFIAMWWAMLPTAFDTLYDVHLFSAIIPFIIIAVLLYFPNIKGRGISIGLMLVTMLLVRNEYLIALLLWGTFCLLFEIYNIKNKNGGSVLKYLSSYGIPVFLAFSLFAAFFSKTPFDSDKLKKRASEKHTLNICQIYAYNKQQQGDIWKGSPWTDCQQIMLRDFGVEEPSLSNAFKINPKKIMGHFLWNFRLIPAGTQLALFNRYSGSANPQYAPAKKNNYVWIPFIGFLLVIIYGLYHFWKEKTWKEEWFSSKVFAWIALLITGGITTSIVMVMQRPRPSYMFNYTLFVLTLFSLGIYLFFRKKIKFIQYKPFVPIAVLVAILIVPSYYNKETMNMLSYKGQYLKEAYQRLKPHVWETDKFFLLTSRPNNNLCAYLNIRRNYNLFSVHQVLSEKPKNLSLLAYIDTLKINYLYLTPDFLKKLDASDLKRELVINNWEELSKGKEEEGKWSLYYKDQ